MHVTGNHNFFTNFQSHLLGLLVVRLVSYSLLCYKYMRDTYIDTLVCICSCMSVILSVFILGRFVDFIQTWNYTIC